MFDDIGSSNIQLAMGGTLTASLALFLLTQLVKEFFPSLRGNKARVVLLVESSLVAFVLIYQADGTLTVEWITTFAVAVLTLFIVAKGIYADVFGQTLDISELDNEELNLLMHELSREFESRRALKWANEQGVA